MKTKEIMQQTDSVYGIMATYAGATVAHITSEAMVNYITILVGVLTTVKLILEIKRQAKSNKTPDNEAN